MCIGETVDTLDRAEQAFLAGVADTRFPGHRLDLVSNGHGITWGVLNPHITALPRVTICRIDPCIMIMLEDSCGRRQFRSLPNVEAAVDFIEDMADEAMLDLGPASAHLH